jgi:flagellin-like protein
MNFRKFKKNAKALSPVIASIILIAVTVAVAVVVAAWMGGLTMGFMGNTEQASITNVQFLSNNEVVATVQNSGTSAVTLVSTAIDGNTATLAAYSPTTTLIINKGTSATVSITVIGASTFADGGQYSFSLLTDKGHTLTYSATYNANPSL